MVGIINTVPQKKPDTFEVVYPLWTEPFEYVFSEILASVDPSVFECLPDFVDMYDIPVGSIRI